VAIHMDELPVYLWLLNCSLHQLAGILQRESLVRKLEASMSWREQEREHWACMDKPREYSR
jgi:hypothetical protein